MYNSNSSALFFFHYNYNYFIYDLIVIYYNDKLQLQIQFLIDKNFKVKLCLIFLQATIHYKSRPLSYRVTPGRRRICKSLVRRNYQSFAQKSVQNVVSRKALVKIVGRTLTKEVAAMCSKKFNSILRAKNRDSMLKFKFRTVLIELKNQAPTLLSLLQSCMKTKTPRVNCNLIIVMIAAMICKHRDSKCSLVHRILSLAMYAGHSAKQVCI